MVESLFTRLYEQKHTWRCIGSLRKKFLHVMILLGNGHIFSIAETTVSSVFIFQG